MEKELYIRRHRDYAVFSKIFAGPVDSDTKQVIINLFNNLIIFARHMQDESLKNSLEFVIDFLQKIKVFFRILVHNNYDRYGSNYIVNFKDMQ